MAYGNRFEFYRSKEWERFRELLLMERMDADGCIRDEVTGKEITRGYDMVLHHKVELDDTNVLDPRVALNPDNIMVVSIATHNRLHHKLGAGGGTTQAVYLVWGSPCAGKTTWVTETAEEDDLIIDMDRLWEAVSISDRMHKPDCLKANVFGLRDCLIDMVRTRRGGWRTAYIIGGYPIKADRDRLSTLLGAREIHIDTDRETCLARCGSEQWRGYVEDWWATFEILGQ